MWPRDKMSARTNNTLLQKGQAKNSQSPSLPLAKGPRAIASSELSKRQAQLERQKSLSKKTELSMSTKEEFLKSQALLLEQERMAEEIQKKVQDDRDKLNAKILAKAEALAKDAEELRKMASPGKINSEIVAKTSVGVSPLQTRSLGQEQREQNIAANDLNPQDVSKSQVTSDELSQKKEQENVSPLMGINSQPTIASSDPSLNLLAPKNSRLRRGGKFTFLPTTVNLDTTTLIDEADKSLAGLSALFDNLNLPPTPVARDASSAQGEAVTSSIAVTASEQAKPGINIANLVISPSLKIEETKPTDKKNEITKYPPNIEGLSFQAISEEGNSLFSAIAGCYGQDKQMLKDIIVTRAEDKPENFSDIISSMEVRTHEKFLFGLKEGAFLHLMDARDLMKILSRPIIVLGLNGLIKNKVTQVEFKGDPIFVCENDENHYDCFLVKPGYDARKILVKLVEQTTLQGAQTSKSRSVKLETTKNSESEFVLPQAPNQKNSLQKIREEMRALDVANQQQLSKKLNEADKEKSFKKPAADTLSMVSGYSMYSQAGSKESQFKRYYRKILTAAGYDVQDKLSSKLKNNVFTDEAEYKSYWKAFINISKAIVFTEQKNATKLSDIPGINDIDFGQTDLSAILKVPDAKYSASSQANSEFAIKRFFVKDLQSGITGPAVAEFSRCLSAEYEKALNSNNTTFSYTVSLDNLSFTLPKGQFKNNAVNENEIRLIRR